MTDKELKRLSRLELLELLVAQGREMDQLQRQLDEATAVLEDRRIKQENVGSIAEAALSLNGVFESAQKAAEQYLHNARLIEQETRQRCEELLAATQARCAELERKAAEKATF